MAKGSNYQQGFHGAGYQPGGGLQYPNDIVAPTQKTLAETLASVQGLVPEMADLTAPTMTAQNVTGIDASKYGDIQGLGNDYYKNMMGEAEKSLRDQYFGGGNSMQNQQKQQMASRGLVGSGIEAGNQNTMFKNFGNTLGSQQAQILASKMQNDLEMAKYNRSNALDLEKSNKTIEGQNVSAANEMGRFNTTNALDVGKTNRESALERNRQLLSTTGDERATGANYDWNIYKAKGDVEGKRAQLAQDKEKSFQDLMTNEHLDEGLRNILWNQYIADSGKPELMQAYQDQLTNDKNSGWGPAGGVNSVYNGGLFRGYDKNGKRI
jgi:hypothetical protein